MQYRIYINSLYDIYGELLTEKQKAYFEEYYLDNLTLQEISENRNISRNAVHSQLKEAEEKLQHYEKILKNFAKKQAILEIIKDDKLKEEIERIIE